MNAIRAVLLSRSTVYSPDLIWQAYNMVKIGTINHRRSETGIVVDKKMGSASLAPGNVQFKQIDLLIGNGCLHAGVHHPMEARISAGSNPVPRRQ